MIAAIRKCISTGIYFLIPLEIVCIFEAMKKSAVLTTLNDFPREFVLEDFLEKLIVIEKIDEGLKDIKEGKTISHESLKKIVNRWQK